jgi:hypothetical protein
MPANPTRPGGYVQLGPSYYRTETKAEIATATAAVAASGRSSAPIAKWTGNRWTETPHEIVAPTKNPRSRKKNPGNPPHVGGLTFAEWIEEANRAGEEQDDALQTAWKDGRSPYSFDVRP